MKISVATLTDDTFFNLDVGADLELENFKAFCEAETGIDGKDMIVVFNGRPLLDNKRSLGSYGLKDGDCVIVQKIERRQQTRRANADPLDAETQRQIVEEIQQNNIDDNMAAAIEYNPETFGTVTMLYINCKVNGFPVKAFVDSGAQATLLSAACAERCQVNHLIDTRWSGIAEGVGTQQIVGRIHMVQLQIEKDYLASSFAVLENTPMDIILGLDMLKRHQCTIDLQRNVLHIGTTGTETPFLPENELPTRARLSDPFNEQMDEEENQINRAIEESQRQAGGGADGSGARLADSLAAPAVTSSSKTAVSTTAGQLIDFKYNESDIQELVHMGFKRDDVITELRLANGNKTQAMAALIVKSFQF